MIRTGLAIFAVGLLGLFGYFFVTAPEAPDSTERAKHAAGQTKDVVVEQGVAGLVRAQLIAEYGLDGARFLHVYSNDGHVLIYGLLPRGITGAALSAGAQRVPGVRTVDVQAVVRPAYVNEVPPTDSSPGDGG